MKHKNLKKRSVIILRGLPGSGKTTVAHGLTDFARARGWSYEIVSADDFFVTTVGESPRPEYRFDPRKLGEAHADCMFRFLAAIGDHRELVIVDNTNVQKWEFLNYAVAATRLNYEVYVESCLDKRADDLTVADLKRFAERNMHGVSFETIAAMAARWEEYDRG